MSGTKWFKQANDVFASLPTDQWPYDDFIKRLAQATNRTINDTERAMNKGANKTPIRVNWDTRMAEPVKPKQVALLRRRNEKRKRLVETERKRAQAGLPSREQIAARQREKEAKERQARKLASRLIREANADDYWAKVNRGPSVKTRTNTLTDGPLRTTPRTARVIRTGQTIEKINLEERKGNQIATRDEVDTP